MLSSAPSVKKQNLPFIIWTPGPHVKDLNMCRVSFAKCDTLSSGGFVLSTVELELWILGGRYLLQKDDSWNLTPQTVFFFFFNELYVFQGSYFCLSTPVCPILLSLHSSPPGIGCFCFVLCFDILSAISLPEAFIAPGVCSFPNLGGQTLEPLSLPLLAMHWASSVKESVLNWTHFILHNNYSLDFWRLPFILFILEWPSSLLGVSVNITLVDLKDDILPF